MKYSLNDLIHAKGITETVQEAVKALQKENGALCAAVKTLQGEKAELIEALCQPSYEEENRLRAEVAKLRAEVKDRNEVIALLQNELRNYRERERTMGWNNG